MLEKLQKFIEDMVKNHPKGYEQGITNAFYKEIVENTGDQRKKVLDLLSKVLLNHSNIWKGQYNLQKILVENENFTIKDLREMDEYMLKKHCLFPEEKIIERFGFQILNNKLLQGKCPTCQTQLDGIWE